VTNGIGARLGAEKGSGVFDPNCAKAMISKSYPNPLTSLLVILSVFSFGTFQASAARTQAIGSPAYLQFVPRYYNVEPGETSLTLTVTRGTNVKEPVSVTFFTADDTAVAGVDYVAASAVLDFAAYETEKTISIEITDASRTNDLAFKVQLYGPTGSGYITYGTATVTLLKSRPQIRIEPGASGALKLSWPATSTDYIVESCDVPIGGEWTPVSGTPIIMAGRATLESTCDCQFRFFRLRPAN
jgi:hypothetical protein